MAGSSNGGFERIAVTATTLPLGATRVSINTVPAVRAFGGYCGIGVVSGIGSAVAAGATSFGGVPTVGTRKLGEPNIAPTSTRDVTGFRCSSSAGAKRQPRTAATTASVNGGVVRTTSIVPTEPVGETFTDSSTSPAATACTGTIVSPPL